MIKKYNKHYSAVSDHLKSILHQMSKANMWLQENALGEISKKSLKQGRAKGHFVTTNDGAEKDEKTNASRAFKIRKQMGVL